MRSITIILIALLFSFYSCKNESGSEPNANEAKTDNKFSLETEEDTSNVKINDSTDVKPAINNYKDSLVAELKDENSLLIITDQFIIKVPGSMDYPLGKTADNIIKNNIIDIDLAIIYCSDMFGKELFFYPLNKDLKIVKIEQQYSSTLFFNEDGSGGTWTIEDVDEVHTDWIDIEQIDKLIFKTLSQNTFSETKPEISENSYAVAEEYISTREIPTIYSEYASSNKLKVFWKTAENESEFIINFALLQGD